MVNGNRMNPIEFSYVMKFLITGERDMINDKLIKAIKTIKSNSADINNRVNSLKPSSPAKTRSKSKKEKTGKGIGDGIKKILNRTMDHAENGNFEIAHNLFHSVKDVAPKHVIAKVRKYLNHIRDNHHI